MGECSSKRYENVYKIFYRVERCGVISLSDGGGAFGFDVTVALLFDDLVAAYQPDALVECGSSVGDTTVYLGRTYRNLAVRSCDIDAFCVSFTKHRTSELDNVIIGYEHSLDLISRVQREFTHPLFFLDAHGGTHWPLANELKAITRGIAVIHDFNINNSRFAYDSYGGIACDAKLLVSNLPCETPIYALQPDAEVPFPCLQVGRRTGIAVVPFDERARKACCEVATTSRRPIAKISKAA